MMRIFYNILFFFTCQCSCETVLAQFFPYPSIPATLRTPDVRGAYLVGHYWENYDFGDTALISKPDIPEQGFANFIDLLPRVDSIADVLGVQAFAARAFSAETPAAVRKYFANLAEHYLYEPNSPMRSDEIYRMFLHQMIDAAGLLDVRERLTFQLESVERNRPGTPAADFEYIDRKGLRSSLLATPGDLTLLFFYDPDCADCHRIASFLSADSLFSANPRLTVLAVCSGADEATWRDKPQPFPTTWRDVHSNLDPAGGKPLYDIRATPTLYLLGRDKHVLLKDATPDAVRHFLQEHP